jgi:hypothetical protein
MMPMPDLASAVDRLEKDNRNLIKRVEKLEKERRSSIPALIANVILLVSAGLLASMLGLFPPPIERLPLHAKTVTAEEFVVRNPEGHIRFRLLADDKGYRFIDASGKTITAR